MENMKAIEIGKYIEFFIKSSQLEKDMPDKVNLKEAVDWAVEKAYGDAKRTMTGIGKFEDAKENALKGMKEKFVEYFSGAVIEEKKAFNEKHKDLCEIWTDEIGDDNLATYGKAQKIVNMTFKYMYCWCYWHCSEKEKWEENKDKKKFQYCHMTLDSYTLNWIYDRTDKEERKNISFTKSVKWSRLDSDFYVEIEKLANEAIKIEKKFEGMPPIEAEFLIWDYEMIREKTNEWVKVMGKYVEENNLYPNGMVKDSLDKTLKDAKDALDKFTLPPSSGKK